MPIGVQTTRNATSQTQATNIMAAVVADLRATPKTAGKWSGTSSQFCIALGTPATLYFDSEGRFLAILRARLVHAGFLGSLLSRLATE